MQRVIGVIGTGLIGGSIGLRARQNGAYAIGWDVRPAALAQALGAGALDAAVPPEELVRHSHTIVIAAHVGGTLSEIARLQAAPKLEAELIVDVASVKAAVAAAARGLRNFVPTHPMAGGERSGAGFARANLFEGKTWAYVPGDGALDRRACDFIASQGGIPFAVASDEHDRLVGVTSHVAQVAAACYARRLREFGPDAAPLCGPVARELLRVAGMDFAMWREILDANAFNVEPQLRALAVDLLAAADALHDRNDPALAALFASGGV